MRKNLVLKKRSEVPPDDAYHEPSFECLVTCYFCSVEFTTNNHKATRECRLEGKSAKHFDFCSQCQDILKSSHFKQLVARPTRRQLRLEARDDDDCA